MPCRSDDRDGGEYRLEADRITRLLCDVLHCIEDDGNIKAMPVAVRRWWNEHKAADAARLAAERGQEQRQRRKVKALAKLTPEERRELGL